MYYLVMSFFIASEYELKLDAGSLSIECSFVQSKCDRCKCEGMLVRGRPKIDLKSPSSLTGGLFFTVSFFSVLFFSILVCAIDDGYW